MKPTDILKTEHRVIEQVLNCLEAIANLAIRDGRIDTADALQAIEFFQRFADQCHHGKEEHHLFLWLESRGMPRDGGPTGIMFYEHEQGRLHIRGMKDAIENSNHGQTEALKVFAQHAHAYINLLREHIQKEDHCLFAMADNAMTEADRQAMLQAFAHVEKEDIGAGVHEHYLQIAETLAQKYNVPKAEIDPHALQCGCHHA
ncbi:MAG: hemerythrin domain-containing protein [bacterium]|jgi:hemerythrin-like domain-containing protein|nr:hemerythrin domain-containing protein [bacterium]